MEATKIPPPWAPAIRAATRADAYGDQQGGLDELGTEASLKYYLLGALLGAIMLAGATVRVGGGELVPVLALLAVLLGGDSISGRMR